MSKKITIFYLEGCPYCKQGKEAIEELKRNNPDFATLDVEWIEESKEAEKAETYDYYYVPSAFFGKEKQYEAHPGETYQECYAHLEKVFTDALN